MVELPAVGTRVSLRYRLPSGSVPPLTDVIGHLMETGSRVRVKTKTGAVVEIAPDDVVAVRDLTAAPVRTSQIRATEHAAALAWPGIERRWMGGWLLRAAGGHTHRANSAVPLGVEADTGAVPAIVDWYSQRGQTPWLAVPDRLLQSPASGWAPSLRGEYPQPKGVTTQLETVVMVRDLPAGESDPTVSLAKRPDEQWLRLYQRKIPVDVLTAVVGGVVVFGTRDDAAVGARRHHRPRRDSVGGAVGRAGGRRAAAPRTRAGTVLGTAGLGSRTGREQLLRAGLGRQCRRDRAVPEAGLQHSAPGPVYRRP